MAIEVVLPRLNSYDIPLLNAVFSPDGTAISPKELQPYRHRITTLLAQNSTLAAQNYNLIGTEFNLTSTEFNLTGYLLGLLN